MWNTWTKVESTDAQAMDKDRAQLDICIIKFKLRMLMLRDRSTPENLKSVWKIWQQEIDMGRPDAASPYVRWCWWLCEWYQFKSDPKVPYENQVKIYNHQDKITRKLGTGPRIYEFICKLCPGPSKHTNSHEIWARGPKDLRKIR